MINVALLLMHAIVGGLLAGHGGQKLFAWSGGSGLEGTGRWLESMGLRPGRQWATLAGLSEFAGGALTALGLLNPIGPMTAIGAMLMAWTQAHRDKPIWVSSGGAELPLTNVAVLSALSISGPGALSLDRLFGIRLPRWVGIASLIAVIGGVAYGTMSSARGGAGAASQAAGSGGEARPSDAALTSAEAGASADEAEGDAALAEDDATGSIAVAAVDPGEGA